MAKKQIRTLRDKSAMHRLLNNLTFRVVLAILFGIITGMVAPEFAEHLKILGDTFVRLVKMVIPAIVFLSIASGIGHMSDMKKLGSIGIKSLVYFEIITTFALIIGMAMAYIIQPGAGFSTAAAASVNIAKYTHGQTPHSFVSFLTGIVPDSVIGALANGEMLPILLFAVLFGLGAARIGDASKPVIIFLEKTNHIFFEIVALIMKLSPIGVFGAIAYTIGKFGIGSLSSLAKLIACSYGTMALFIFVVLGLICRIAGIRITKLLAYFKDELILVLGTSSSESAMPSLIRKMKSAGCSDSVTGLVIPTGYSFNLDGTAIYLSIAVLFIAQAYGIHLGLLQLLSILGVLLLTSKGAAGVTGSGFVTLAATLYAMPNHILPVAGIALILGVDRFMSEARAITNFVGNAVATVVIAKLEGEYTPQGLLE